MNTPDYLTKMPEPLQPGDHVMLAAPARHVTKVQVDAATEAIEAGGFTAVMPEGLLAQQGQFGGSDAHRARVMNQGFESLKIKAIWVMRGGLRMCTDFATFEPAGIFGRAHLDGRVQ